MIAADLLSVGRSLTLVRDEVIRRSQGLEPDGRFDAILDSLLDLLDEVDP